MRLSDGMNDDKGDAVERSTRYGSGFGDGASASGGSGPTVHMSYPRRRVLTEAAWLNNTHFDDSSYIPSLKIYSVLRWNPCEKISLFSNRLATP